MEQGVLGKNMAYYESGEEKIQDDPETSCLTRKQGSVQRMNGKNI